MCLNRYLDQSTVAAIDLGSIDFGNHILVREITQFAWLWPFFESLKCSRSANRTSLKEFNNQQPDELNAVEVSSKHYFADRYLRQPNAGDRLTALIGYTEPAIRMRTPIELGLAENSQPRAARTALLFVVYRLRNNFFHGEKQQRDMNDQLDNFVHTNNLLRCWLE